MSTAMNDGDRRTSEAGAVCYPSGIVHCQRSIIHSPNSAPVQLLEVLEILVELFDAITVAQQDEDLVEQMLRR